MHACCMCAYSNGICNQYTLFQCMHIYHCTALCVVYFLAGITLSPFTTHPFCNKFAKFHACVNRQDSFCAMIVHALYMCTIQELMTALTN